MVDQFMVLGSCLSLIIYIYIPHTQTIYIYSIWIQKSVLFVPSCSIVIISQIGKTPTLIYAKKQVLQRLIVWMWIELVGHRRFLVDRKRYSYKAIQRF